MKLIDLLFRKREIKSYTSNNSVPYSQLVYLDNYQQVEGSNLKSFIEHCKHCEPLQICYQRIAKTFSQVELIGQDIKGGEIKETQNTDIFNFIDILKNPNGNPFPKTFVDIAIQIIKDIGYKGIAGFILKGKNGSFDEILIPSNIIYVNNIFEDYYDVGFNGYVNLDNKIGLWSFKKNEDGLYQYIKNDDIYTLFTFGNYDVDKGRFVPLLEQIKYSILTYNLAKEFAVSFHQNSCRPVGIITVNLPENTNMMTNEDKQRYLDTAIKSLSGLKGSKNGGSTLVTSGVLIDIKPISLPSTAEDINNHCEPSKKIILSYYRKTLDAIEGGAKYDNATINLEDSILGDLDLLELMLDNINIILKKLLKYNSFSGTPRLWYDASNIDHLKKIQNENLDKDFEKGRIPLGYYIEKKRKFEEYSDMKDIPNSDDIYIFDLQKRSSGI